MDTASKLTERMVGAVLLLIGVGFGALAGFVIERQLTLTGTIESSALIGAIIFAALGLVFGGMGFRLAANKPNKYGSLLPPAGWYAMTGVLLALCGGAVILAIVRNDSRHLSGVVFAGLLALWCWTTAKDARAFSTGASPSQENPLGAASGSRAGYFRLLTFRGIPIFVHRSLPMGGLLFAIYAGFDTKNVLYYCVGYFLLVAAHEAAHAVAAGVLGLKVSSIDITGAGGMCYIEAPRKVVHGVIVYSAGIVIQLVLLVATLVYLSVAGVPSSAFGQSLVATFTIANVIVLILNIIPRRTGDGLATDGSVLWQLFLHAYKGRPNPFENFIAVPSDESPIFPPDTNLLTIPELVPKDFKQGVEILNDSTTPMEFVVSCFNNHLGLNQQEAVMTMLQIHNKGGILIALPSLERANEVACAIAAEAKQHGYSFTCRAVEVTTCPAFKTSDTEIRIS